MRIKIKTGTIGPHHDPYGTETLIVTNDAGKDAVYYQDGLGMERLTLVDADGHVVRVVRLIDREDRQTKQTRLKMRILFRRHVGIDTADAVAQYERSYGADPYGPESRYT